MILSEREYINLIINTINNNEKYYIHKKRINKALLKALNKIKGGIRIEYFIDNFMVIYK